MLFCGLCLFTYVLVVEVLFVYLLLLFAALSSWPGQLLHLDWIFSLNVFHFVLLKACSTGFVSWRLRLANIVCLWLCFVCLFIVLIARLWLVILPTWLLSSGGASFGSK